MRTIKSALDKSLVTNECLHKVWYSSTTSSSSHGQRKLKVVPSNSITAKRFAGNGGDAISKSSCSDSDNETPDDSLPEEKHQSCTPKSTVTGS